MTKESMTSKNVEDKIKESDLSRNKYKKEDMFMFMAYKALHHIDYSQCITYSQCQQFTDSSKESTDGVPVPKVCR